MMNKAILAATALLLTAAVPASAADLLTGGGLKDVGFATPSTWAGYYLGADLGYGWDSKTTFTDPIPGINDSLENGTRPQGVFGGLSANALWQTSGFVWGIGTEINYANIADNSAVAATTLNGASALTSTIDYWGTLHARAGLPLGPLLVYGTGGLAYGGVEARAAGANTALSNAQLRAGWMAGGGAALKISPGWIAGVEYNHVDLGSDTFSTVGIATVPAGPTTVTAAQHNEFEAVKAYLAYKLGSDYAHPLN